MDHTDEIVRLLAIQLRRDAGSQAQAIDEMHKVGFGTSRIAELLGTTPNTVNVTISKQKKRDRGG